jgi:phosphatidylglycerol:prolipoprotein diacylglycerol transferase
LYPVLFSFEIFGHERVIASYGAFCALGLLLTTLLSLRKARELQINIGYAIAFLGFAFAFGFGGATSLFFVVELFVNASITQIGVVFYGALIGVLGLVFWTHRYTSFPILKWLDLSLPNVALGHAFGRMGCFLGGCCYGKPFELYDTQQSQVTLSMRHPTQLYEAFFLLLLALLLTLWRPKQVGNGFRTCFYLFVYAAFRFAIEWLRGDSERGFWIAPYLSTSQGISLLFMVLTLSYYYSRHETI